MTPSREDVVAAVRALFPHADASAILAVLDEYGARSWERERDRVQCAIVRLSEGDEDRLRYFLGVAKQDYHDVLFWSEHPEEAKIDTPEKRRRVREMFEKLGLEPPRSLNDTCPGLRQGCPPAGTPFEGVLAQPPLPTVRPPY